MSTVLSKDGTAIAFDKLGSGEPVILVDGALCSRSFGPLPKLAQLLAHHFTVFHYDRRGRNESGDTSPYAVERELEDLEALIAKAGGSASVFGTSSGAALALAAAAGGANIRKLALYEPPFVAVSSARTVPPDSEARLRRLIAAGRRGDALKFFMVDMVGMPAIFIYIMRVLPIWPKLKAVAHTLPNDAAVLGDFSLPKERAASVRVPTLVIGGEKSPVELRSAVSAVAQTVPGAKLRMLKGQNAQRLRKSPSSGIGRVLWYLEGRWTQTAGHPAKANGKSEPGCRTLVLFKGADFELLPTIRPTPSLCLRSPLTLAANQITAYLQSQKLP